MPAGSPTRLGESSRLRLKIDLAMPVLRAAGRRFLDHPQPRAAYREYLFAAHAVVRASVPLMETALARARTTAADDPDCARLATYLAEHIVEEADHDEWVLEDLEVLGVDRPSVLARTPSPAVATLVGAQYYWIQHAHPVALLGYMAVLEGSPPSPAVVAHLVERTGYDPRAFRALREHSVVDEHHGDEVFALIDELSAGPSRTTLLGLSGLHTVAAMAAVMDEIVDRASAVGG